MGSRNNKVLLVGSGYMAREYMKVLASLANDVVIVGRSKEKIYALQKDYPKFEYFSGGLDKFLEHNLELPHFAINATSINQLRITSLQLLEAGIKYLLLEKPGDITLSGLNEINQKAISCSAEVLIAYNRRHYSSISTLIEQIEIDGGITSAHFEFTEWVHTIDPVIYDTEALQKWIISNSSHVIDTVFYLIGIPRELHATVKGKNAIDWHPSGSIFTGVGLSVEDIPFTYHSNWEGPGRWAIEISTQKRRFYLKPMEKLQQQLKGSVQVTDIKIDDRLDQEYKAGLFLQTQCFLNADLEKMIGIEDQVKILPFYYSMGGY